MLLVFDESVKYSDVERAEVAVAIENVLGSYFEGSHIVVAPYDVVDWIAASFEHGTKARAALRKMYSKAMELDSAIEQFCRKVVVKSDRVDAIYSDNAWTVPITFFYPSSFCQPSALIAENELDCKAYQAAASHYRHVSNKTYFDFRMRPQGGGGSTISGEFRNLVFNRKELALCVTDGDRCYPGAGMSAVSKECRRVVEESNSICEHQDIHERDVENIIPSEIIRRSVPTEILERQNSTSHILDACCPEAHRYRDMKCGVKGDWILKKSPSSPVRVYWEGVASSHAVRQSIGRSCFDDGFCNAPESCNCKVVEGLGGNLLNHVVKFLDENGPYVLSDNCFESATSWLSIGEIVFEWGCASEPIRI